MKSNPNHDQNAGSRSSRRQFLGQTAAAVATTTLLGGAAAAKEKKAPFVAKAPGRVLGANDRINIAFIGNGMQFLSLLRMFSARRERQKDVEFLAACDVWEPRVKNAQQKTGAPKTYADYREVLARPDIDGVVVAVPDHWHFPIARDACAAGKDVYLEKPMTYTIEEAAELNNIVGQSKRILQVGGSGPATRLYWKVNDYIKAGKMGKICWGLISYNRNTHSGMWDYPIPGIGSEAWPDAEVSAKNLDWKTWLGSAPKRPFSKERYFRWRKFWDYSGGNATDLLFHRLGAMNTMIGFDFPSQVVGAGGIYVQKNREVPDVYMTMVEYPGDYCINMISCMANEQSAPISIYGNWATLEIVNAPAAGGAAGGQTGGGPRQRFRTVARVRAERQFRKEFEAANDGQSEVTIESEPSPDLVDDWLDCMRSRGNPVYNVLRGYQVMVAIRMGVDSYRQGRVMAFDPARRRILPAPPPHSEYLPKDA